MVKVFFLAIVFLGSSWVSAATIENEPSSPKTNSTSNLTTEINNLKEGDKPEEVILDVSGLIQPKSQFNLPVSATAPKDSEPIQQEVETFEEKASDLDSVKLDINMAPISPTDLQLLNSFIYFKSSRSSHTPNEQI